MDNGQQAAKQRKMGRLPIIVILVTVILLFAFFLKDILIPFIDMEVHNDVDGATALLREKGVFGFLTVALVEALQMVVIFIPAEFIQISSGLSYPFPMALALCDIGVCLGATIIFILVRVFHVQSDAFEKRRGKIDKLSANVRDRNTVFLLYLLFFMPLIPFGAICYYGSGTKLKYRRYILTVATGVVPSIVVSNLMGAAGKAFIENSLPMWLLIVIIVVLAAILFAIIVFFIKKFIFKGAEGTPDSLLYFITFHVFGLLHGRRQKAQIDDRLLNKVQVPYLLLANHESFFDFYYISKMNHPKNPAYMVNDYYCTRPFLRRLAKSKAIIPKKLFVPDMASSMSVLRILRAGYPIVIFPEGRLSPDGRSNPLVDGGAFYRRLGVDIVLVKITGAYFSNPKWRRRRFLSDIKIKVERVLKADEIKDMDSSELDRLITRTLYNDASENPCRPFPQKGKALGLENILYRCADCGALYSTMGVGNDLVCTKCGARHTLDDRYHFTGDIRTIGEYYDRIRQMEESTLDSFELSAKVRTKIHIASTGRSKFEDGECHMDRERFSYRSQSVEFSVPLKDMSALAFSSGQEFEIYNGNDLMYFYPEKERQQVARWALLVDMVAERRRQNEKG